MSRTLTITPEQVMAAAEREREAILCDRRTLHAAPEVGAELPHTLAYVKARLTEMGYEPHELAGCTLFRITVTGVGCHGAMPEKGVDPLNIAAHIYLSLQEIVSREIAAKMPAVVTIGRMSGGEAPNIIPQSAVLEGTIRSFDRDLSAQILERIVAIAQCTAQAFRGTAEVTELASAPPLKNDTALTNRMADLAGALFGEKLVYRLDEGGMGSEDFASYTYDLPCAYLLIGAGTKQENPVFGAPMHNEKVVFNEEILPRGAALHTWCALNWLLGEGNA